MHTDAFTIPWINWTKPFANPPMESDFSCSTQDCTGEASLDLPGSSILAERHMAHSGTMSGSLPTFDAITTNDSNDVSQNASSPSSSELDALCVAIIHNKLVKANLQEQAIADLMAQKLAKNGTNRLYRKNQLRFLAWAVDNGVSYTTFSGADLVNFLAYIRQTHHLEVSTLKTTRVAVTHLHDSPKDISEDPLANSYLDSLSRQASLVSIHCETVDLTPSLAYARSIPSKTSTFVKLIQQKLAFLLAMAAFLRPSDLARIPFSSCTVDSNSGCLKFHVVSPKETRSEGRIIKPFTIRPHATDVELCPVKCFLVLRDHPALQARPRDSQLFVKSNNAYQPLSFSTLSSWLHREFISLSTSESQVSIRSLASSRALDQGVPLQDIVTLGNWASADTFRNHYQRNHMAQIDFTSKVLSGTGQGELFDAQDIFSLG
ncbi:hypothetical protein PS15p_212273 [Mucor circinelloides]